ncbi:MAG: hypothetical protein IT437_10580 [Phycisphaerales bacterium]|nr:hypothetical protein [Phycisphaerales bacterium]
MMRLSFCVRLAGLGMAAAALSLGACKSTDNTDKNHAAASEVKVQTVNTVCPIEGGSFKQGSRDVAETRTWKGKTIGFCCDGCPAAFDKMSPADKDKVLSMAQSNTKPEGGHH